MQTRSKTIRRGNSMRIVFAPKSDDGPRDSPSLSSVDYVNGFPTKMFFAIGSMQARHAE
jgi:hypothetical protein